MLPRFLLLTALLFAGLAPALAQVATPSLDPSRPLSLAAATGWRFSSTVGASSAYGTWDVTESGGSTNSAKYTKLTYMLASHVVGPFYTEASNVATQMDAPNSTGTSNLDQQAKSQANFALRLGDLLALGGHYFNSTLKTRSETSIALSTSKEEQIGIGTSLSLGLGELLYLGWGSETITESSTTKVDNGWGTQQIAVALRNGQNKESRWLLEYSQSSTPESIKATSTSDNKLQNNHYSSKETRLTAEGKIPFNLIVRYENRSSITHVAGDQNFIESSTRYGLVWLPESWIVGFSLTTGLEKYVFQDASSNYEKAQPASTRINVGYRF